MEDLLPRAEDDSEVEPKREERENDETEHVPEEQVRGDPPAE